MSDENRQKLRELPSFQADQIRTLQERITALEKNCEVSFVKVEDHIIRILKVIDVQAQSTEMLTDQIAELKKREEKNGTTNTNFKTQSTGEYSDIWWHEWEDERKKNKKTLNKIEKEE